MPDIARIRWTTPEPTAVDEHLLVFPDGTALLVVRTSRRGDPVVGTWRGTASPADLAVLDGRDVEVDLLHPVDDEVIAAADRLAAEVKEPVAVLAFAVNPLPDGRVVLLAVGDGSAPAGVELDPASLVVHLERADGSELAWHPVPPLVTGFTSPEAHNLGGVRSPTLIHGGEYGGISLDAPADPGATQVSIGFAGWLRDAAGDEADVRPFRVRTAAAPLA
ncbi:MULTISPECIES: hypothetical protein [Nocardioides]|uniref:Uncharacterized protein n=1 Tax=Nocardioides vastitatis TaxID=2568655 RepID=A0ABW0ZI92_9ACTN|nr:hypothetical protein [Nocardioides sp.]